MSDAILGQLIEVEAMRDAIHVAIAPVVAAHVMTPGTHIGLLDNGAASAKADKLIGIVDPFLREDVVTGERFWLCLYQKTVTGMRHEWSHPAFIAAPQCSSEPESEVDVAKRWIVNYAEVSCDGISYNDLMRAARDYAEHGAYLIQGGRFEGMSVSDEFWDHYEIVTGKKVESGNRGVVFSCSC